MGLGSEVNSHCVRAKAEGYSWFMQILFMYQLTQEAFKPLRIIFGFIVREVVAELDLDGIQAAPLKNIRWCWLKLNGCWTVSQNPEDDLFPLKARSLIKDLM